MDEQSVERSILLGSLGAYLDQANFREDSTQLEAEFRNAKIKSLITTINNFRGVVSFFDNQRFSIYWIVPIILRPNSKPYN